MEVSGTYIPPMWRSPQHRPPTRKSSRTRPPVDHEYRKKVSDFAAKQQARQGKINSQKEKLRLETHELIKKGTGPNMRCPNCNILCQRGGGLVINIIDKNTNVMTKILNTTEI